MATVNKTERKKMVSTEVVGTQVVWFDARDGSEFGRVDLDTLAFTIAQQLKQYGIKQIVADIVATATSPDDKIKGMRGAIDQINAGQWPRRAPAEGSLTRAIDMLMAAQGITRGAARAMLGLGEEDGNGA